MVKKWLQLFNLRASADFEGTVRSISDGVSLRGYNLWLLLCASMLASIGLDTNSAAIIIGAMLISPLMSPILGVGLSVAINDKSLLLRSASNLVVAVVISLATSVTYFLVTPLGLPTEQLQARTFPTLLDVLVALFGGLAGIISISRKGPTNAIPGVAIATALMPPLCTAGFGIATGNWIFFAGAFYLFFLNAVFISLATFLIVKHLHFPILRLGNKKLRRMYSFWFGVISFVALLPSVYFLYTLYQKEVIRQKIDEEVISVIKKHGNEVLKWELEQKDAATLVKIYHSGNALSDSLKKRMDSTLAFAGLTHFKIQPMRINMTKEEVANLSADITKQMFAEMHIQELLDNPRESGTLTYTQVWREVKILFPEIDSAANGWILSPGANGIDTVALFTYFSPGRLKTDRERLLTAYLEQRLKIDSATIIFSQKKIK
jgi:uncharacterized hydrophobic protein (TIGR00271 family)